MTKVVTQKKFEKYHFKKCDGYTIIINKINLSKESQGEKFGN